MCGRSRACSSAVPRHSCRLGDSVARKPARLRFQPSLVTRKVSRLQPPVFGGGSGDASVTFLPPQRLHRRDMGERLGEWVPKARAPGADIH